MCIVHHCANRIATVCGIDHRQFFGVLPQQTRPPQNFAALGGKNAKPLAETPLRAGDCRVNVRGRRIGDPSKRLAAAWTGEIHVAARERGVPSTGVVKLAVIGESQARGHDSTCRWTPRTAAII
jgi:hypothetical protein